MPGRRARTPRQPAGRARPRRKRQRPPSPHDSPRHELRADAARRSARGRRRGPWDHLRVRRSAPEAPVRVRQDPMAQRRHLYRRPSREGPPRRAEGRIQQLHDPPAAHPPPPAGTAALRRHPRRRVLLRSGPASAALARGAHDVTEGEDVATTQTGTDRWKALDFGPPPSSEAEPDQPVLADYVADGHVAVSTLNRPHADNAITTEMGVRLTEILETIAVRPSIRVAIITGAGTRAFPVGSDLPQRKDMTKEDWLRQRQDFDRTLYTLRQLRKPIFAAVNGIAYGGGSEIAQSTDFIIASENATFGQPEAMIGLAAGGGSPVFLPRILPPGKALQMLMTGDPTTASRPSRTPTTDAGTASLTTNARRLRHGSCRRTRKNARRASNDQPRALQRRGAPRSACRRDHSGRVPLCPKQLRGAEARRHA